jgi:ribosomal protein L7Ae-like RNA K-turn-binding protein
METERKRDGAAKEVRPRRLERVGDRMNADVRQRMLRLLGLGMRSRGVVVGVSQVREAAKRDKVFFAVVATDVSSNSLDKVVPLLNGRRIKFVEVPSAAELGAAVGRVETAVVGIVDQQLAAGVNALVTSGSSGATEEDV